MIEPLNALIIASIGGVIFLFIFWPEKGLFWKWKRGKADTKRILVEDGLKHLYDQEYKHLTCTLQSLSGALNISGDETANLIAGLQSLGLIKTEKERIELTSEGRKEALRMIRIHRLWERYLADETGIEQTKWHERAEILEHNMTDKQLKELEASVGNPSYDPHGDPIPTATGKLPPKKGLPLTDIAVDEQVRIIHIEDEPAAVYAQLVAEGLHPGMQIRVIEKNPRRIQFITEGEEIILAPIVAANITVEKLPEDFIPQGPFENLTSLKSDEMGKVLNISVACRGQQRRRLLDLGIVPGTIISMEMPSASGDPIAYKIRGATIALRKSQAGMIHIARVKEMV